MTRSKQQILVGDIDRLLDGRSIEDIERELDRQIEEQNALPEPAESPAEATQQESYSTLNSAQGNSDKTVDISENSGIIELGSGKMTIASPIETPIEQKHTGKGNPNAILQFDVSLNNRQQALLDKMPNYDSRISVPKKSVNMADLSALTAKTGDEFAMFTKGGERLILRGDSGSVNIDASDAKLLAEKGYRWSGHTHPGTTFLCMQASDGDYSVLGAFDQEMSVIYNSKGDYRTFEKMG